MSQRILLLVVTLLLGACDTPSPRSTSDEAPPQPRLPEVTEVLEQCAECHGPDGNRGAGGAPFIGGQRRDYLALAIRAYLNGLRHHPHMRQALLHLDRHTIDALAAHYASQPRVWKPKIEEETLSAEERRLRRQGRELARSCGACHGEHGISRRPEVPHLAGLDRDYMVRALRAYIGGDRHSALMEVYKAALDGDEIEALAAYFSALPRPAPSSGKSDLASARLAHRCHGCHGGDGAGGVPGIPHLAGQQAGYLAAALKAYREGIRRDPEMGRAVRHLSDRQIKKLARHFAGRDATPPPYGALQFGPRHDPLGDGRLIARACDGCHDPADDTTPNLQALPAAYIEQALAAYAGGQRDHGPMKRLTAHLNAFDREKVALHYASATPPRPPLKPRLPEADLVTLAEGCNACHGEGGNSHDEATPSLAAQNRGYLIDALRAYARGERNHERMAAIAAELDEEQIGRLARHYAGLPRRPREVRIPESGTAIAERCDRCHGAAAVRPDPTTPLLEGQSPAYLVRAIEAYKEGVREHSAMNAMSAPLTPLEIHAVARHYATLPPR